MVPHETRSHAGINDLLGWAPDDDPTSRREVPIPEPPHQAHLRLLEAPRPRAVVVLDGESGGDEGAEFGNARQPVGWRQDSHTERIESTPPQDLLLNVLPQDAVLE